MSRRRIGVIDIGSNSVRFVIYALYGAAFTPVYNEKVLAGLGRDLRETGRLDPDGWAQALAAIARFSLLARARGLHDRLLIGATAALRDAQDAPDFIAEVLDETALKIVPISGAEEARLTAMGVGSFAHRADGIVADLGGASLEIVAMRDGTPEPGQSFPIGPFPIMGESLTDVNTMGDPATRERVTSALSQLHPLSAGQTLFLVGGAWRNLFKIHQERSDYPLHVLQGYALDADTARRHAAWAHGPGFAEVLAWPTVSSRRCETLPYGAWLLEILIDRLAPARIVISAAGLREGLMQSALSGALAGRDSLIDACRDLARGNLQETGFAAPLSAFLGPVEDRMPAGLDWEEETRLRLAAQHLAGMGKGLHPDYRADLVFADVLYAPLPRLTHRQRAYLAQILFSTYTARSKTPNEAALDVLLSPGQRACARAYGHAIRLAIAASGRTVEMLGHLRMSWNDGPGLIADPDYDALLTERVTYRLEKLKDVLRLASEIPS